MRSRYKIIDDKGIHFITSTIVEWLPVFANEKYFNVLLDNFKFYQKKYRLKIHAYVILDNHFHAIISSEDDLRKAISSLKRFTAKRIIDELINDNNHWLLNQFEFHKKSYKTNSKYQIWQEGSHPQLISSTEILNQKIEYIHHNPVRRGLVDNPEDWIYSSAIDYMTDMKGLIEIEKIY